MHESSQEQKHRHAAESQLSEEGRRYFKLIEFDTNEELVTEIRKHPFGLALVYATGGFVIATLLAIAIGLSRLNLNEFFGGNVSSTLAPIVILAAFLLMVGGIVITFIAAFLYKSNVIYVTSEKIAQVVYISLFNRKISQLSIGDVQDVTVTQKGIFAHAFNYGTLVIETSGEQQNYTFSYVPDPYQKSKLLVGAHERNLIAHGN